MHLVCYDGLFDSSPTNALHARITLYIAHKGIIFTLHPITVQLRPISNNVHHSSFDPCHGMDGQVFSFPQVKIRLSNLVAWKYSRQGQNCWSKIDEDGSVNLLCNCIFVFVCDIARIPAVDCCGVGFLSVLIHFKLQFFF